MLQGLQEKTLALTIALMERQSVSPDDAGCQTLMSERLRPLGFNIEPMPFGAVTNLWAVKDGGLPGPTVVFAGHTDVVPTGPEEDWTYPPFEPTLTDGWLFGRGSADMKSALAAMVVAVEQFLQSGDP
ncbi:MAG: M20/M25/M40 family metallo-hydrolase, partial [Pseudomonadales bacterium]